MRAVAVFTFVCALLFPVAASPIQSAVAAAEPDPVIAAAGDIACDPNDPDFGAPPGTGANCRDMETSDLLVGAGLDAVLALGDIQYPCANTGLINASYDQSWGRVKSITHPAVGNHEYNTSANPPCDGLATDYFSYFGASAGNPGEGYYSYDIGEWHIVAPNSNCSKVGGCHPGSPQEQWLRADLAANPASCTLAYWHHARWSSGSKHGSDPKTEGLVRALYEAGADVVLTAHDHNYERFAPQDPSGVLDTQAGLRQFVVGTGGKSLRDFDAPIANSEVRASAFGMLKLTLHPNSYDWDFEAIPGEPFSDSGTTACHGTNVVTLVPVADAYVYEVEPDQNFGLNVALRTDNSPLMRSFVRFDAQGVAGAQTVLLRVFAESANNLGVDLHTVADTGWGESTIRFNNAPVIGPVVGSSGPITAGTWVIFDVTDVVTRDGLVSFALTSQSNTATKFSSAEGTNPPELVLNNTGP